VDVAFPLQFTADIEIIAHLVPDDGSYPPRTRMLKVMYDYTNKLARADIAKGFEAEKTYIRRYDEKQEYMVRPEPIGDCKRSYLGEVMPFPVIPDAILVGITEMDGIECNHYMHVDFDTHIDVYLSKSTGSPVRIVQSSRDDSPTEPGQPPSLTPVLTYVYSNVRLAAPSANHFELPSPYTYTNCDNQIGGFPYVHIAHYFVKF